MRISLSRNKLIYRIVLVALLVISILILIKLSPTLTKPENIPSDDFVRYWASGNLNLHGKDPYSPQSIEQIQVAFGDLVSGQNSITLNPPWVVALLMPFGLLDYPLSRLVWMIASIILILVSSLLLWRIYSGDPKKRWLAMAVAFIFAPTISLLEKGQITGMVLLGVSGFLYFTVINRRDLLAGAFLALVTIKPQMLIIFWIAVLFWVIRERRWSVIAGVLIAVSSLLLVAMIFNPNIVSQYLGMLRNNNISNWAVPTIGSYLRYYWLGLQHFWLQFLPTLLAFIWFILYWLRHHSEWDWKNEMPIILLVSLISSPYMWTYDVVVLIPAVILAAYYIAENPTHWLSVALILFYLVINVLDLVLHMRLDDFWFIWLVPVIFVWYLIARMKHPEHQNIDSRFSAEI